MATFQAAAAEMVTLCYLKPVVRSQFLEGFTLEYSEGQSGEVTRYASLPRLLCLCSCDTMETLFLDCLGVGRLALLHFNTELPYTGSLTSLAAARDHRYLDWQPCHATLVSDVSTCAVNT